LASGDGAFPCEAETIQSLYYRWQKDGFLLHRLPDEEKPMAQTWPLGFRLPVVCLGAFLMTAAASKAQPPASADGTVHLDGVSLPISNLLSPEAQDNVRGLVTRRPDVAALRDMPADIKSLRARADEAARAVLEPMEKRYPVTVREAHIGGVFVQIVTPTQGVAPENKRRVLLNMHGGGFMAGARTTSLLESIPVAATMRVEVISVDYRMAPEFQFPAASEDVAAVYREILKSYKPSQVGLYGCSAGGILAGESIAWFLAHDLPKPGAVGLFCASLDDSRAGDSGSLAGPLMAMGAGAPRSLYLANARRDDPLAYPIASAAVLAAFPPTLFITGTRSMELSSAANSQNQLSKAGVETEFFVWDGLYHAFIYNSDLPEAREAYAVTTRFFERHLAR
jgi:epsilon-lactone hydrolase